MEPGTLALLVLVAFVAAFIDSIVGGGGVISLPALLAAGLPPHLALGTNKLAATGASLSATVRYAHARLLVLPLVAILVPLSLLGSVAGASAVLELEARFVRVAVFMVMALMTLYVVVRPEFGARNRFKGVRGLALVPMALVAVAVGFYDGFLGPGTGSLLLFAFLGLHKFDFLHAAAHGRVLNLASNAGALGLFAVRGYVDYAVGLPMMAAMVAGGLAGSHFGIRKGLTWVKPLFVAITVALMGKLAFEAVVG